MLKEVAGHGPQGEQNQTTGNNKRIFLYLRLTSELQKKEALAFAVVPLLLFIFMLFRLAELHAFFQGWIDPVYVYLMNGLTFALGSNDIGHVDHPGTPLQLFIALLITIIGWLHSPGDLATDVLTHPEYYLRSISIVLILINCAVIWLLGHFAYRKLKNIQLSVAVQLLPLLSFQLLNYMPVVACETVITFLALAIAVCIILYDPQNENSTRLLVWITILSALTVATKISTLAILIVPFFVFEKIRTKALYLGLTFLLILVFVSPVLSKLGIFTNFMGQIATHTGKYGSGEAKMFDASIFLQSLKLMLTKEYTFTLHVLLLPIGWAVIARQNIRGLQRRIYLAVTLATVFQMIIVARHYSFHYLMPVFALCIPLHGYFWIQLFNEKISKIPSRIMSVIVVLLVGGVFTRLVVKNNFQQGIVNSVEKTTRAVQSELKGKYVIITENNNDSAFPEPALRFGLSYCGPGMKARFIPILSSVYPGNYLWNSVDGFTDWNKSYLASEVFSSQQNMYIYANTGSCEFSKEKITGMIHQAEMTDFVTLKFVYQNENKGEVIAQAMIDHAKLASYYQNAVNIETSMEEVHPGGELIQSSNPEYSFKGGTLLSERFARNGKKSILLTASNPYGLNIFIPVSAGSQFKVEFWQKSTGQQQAVVVATASKSEIFYKTSAQTISSNDAWNRSELNISISKDYPESTLHFYLWNPSQDSIWVDDFRLSVFK